MQARFNNANPNTFDQEQIEANEKVAKARRTVMLDISQLSAADQQPIQVSVRTPTRTKRPQGNLTRAPRSPSPAATASSKGHSKTAKKQIRKAGFLRSIVFTITAVGFGLAAASASLWMW